jgi:hypothetical protein
MRNALCLATLVCAGQAIAGEAPCTEATLRAWQPGSGPVTLEHVKEEQVEPPSEPRQASIKCKLDESEEACESRARKEVIAKNPTWTIVEARPHGAQEGYEALIDVDGAAERHYFLTIAAVEELMAKLKARGHKIVVLTKLHAVSKPETRTIEVHARAPGKKKTSRMRLRARLHWKPTGDAVQAVSAAQRAAALANMSLSLFERRDDGTFTIVIACP